MCAVHTYVCNYSVSYFCMCWFLHQCSFLVWGQQSTSHLLHTAVVKVPLRLTCIVMFRENVLLLFRRWRPWRPASSPSARPNPRTWWWRPTGKASATLGRTTWVHSGWSHPGIHPVCEIQACKNTLCQYLLKQFLVFHFRSMNLWIKLQTLW